MVYERSDTQCLVSIALFNTAAASQRSGMSRILVDLALFITLEFMLLRVGKQSKHAASDGVCSGEVITEHGSGGFSPKQREVGVNAHH